MQPVLTVIRHDIVSITRDSVMINVVVMLFVMAIAAAVLRHMGLYPEWWHNTQLLLPLEQKTPNFHYKGEDNLKNLDEPAFERRTSPITAAPEARGAREEGLTNGQSEYSAKIKRLHVDDLKERPERIRKDNSEVPAFLRKMMD